MALPFKCQFPPVFLLIIVLLWCQCYAQGLHRFALKSHQLRWHKPATTNHAMATRGIAAAVPAKFYSVHLLIGNISVGTPSQNFQVAFQLDMASSYLIGPDADLSDQGNYKKNIFDAGNSSTYKRIWGDFESESHDVYGEMGSDMGMLGGQKCLFSFGVADYVPYYVERMPIDGEMGLAPRFDSQNGVESLMQQLARSLDPTKQLLSVRIKPHEDVDDIDDIPYDSALTIGEEDRENCHANWHYVPLVASQGCWRIELAYYFIANGNTVKRRQLTSANDNRGGLGLRAEIAELNRHLRINYGPKRWIRRIAQELGGEFDAEANLYRLDCVRSSTANLTFGIGEPDNAWTWTMSPAEFTIKRDGRCYLSFYAIDIGLWGFSSMFYAKNCATLDFGKNLIGFSTPVDAY